MNGDIFPEIIKLKLPVLAIFNDREPGTFIIVDIGGGISRASFKNDDITWKEIDSVRFSARCNQLFFDAERQIIYGFGRRDFHAIDLKTKQYRKIITSFDGNDMILFSTLLKEDSIQFLIQTIHTGWTDKDSYEVYSIYDFEKNSTVFSTGRFQGGGMLYPIGKNNLLYQKWNRQEPTDWFFTDNTLSQKITNKFTDELTALSMGVWDHGFNYDKQIFVGFAQYDSAGSDREILYMVRWKPDFTDYSIFPFTFHEPEHRSIQEYFEISPDGKWIKGISADDGLEIRENKVAFYHSDTKYPSGLSLAVHGSTSILNWHYPGAFVETKQWGMVYIDIFKGLDGLLFIYKMSDVLEQVVLRANEMVE